MSAGGGLLWDASAFGLQKARVFNQLAPEAKDHLLRGLGDELIRESCYIEMAGMAYAARMSLESGRIDERIFYSQVAGEEARHYCLLKPYANDEVLARGPDPFTALIGEIIDTSGREEAIFLIQVLLEGWGLSHFSHLSVTAKSEEVRSVFKSILRDEARHHAGGVALSKEFAKINDPKVNEWLAEILEMVRVGPTRIMSALEAVSDQWRPSVRQETLDELDSFRQTQRKLSTLRALIATCLNDKALGELESKGLFTPA